MLKELKVPVIVAGTELRLYKLNQVIFLNTNSFSFVIKAFTSVIAKTSQTEIISFNVRDQFVCLNHEDWVLFYLRRFLNINNDVTFLYQLTGYLIF